MTGRLYYCRARGWRHSMEAPIVAGPTSSSFRRRVPIDDMHIVWMTAGLGCDGDSVSMTAATQPSLEDIVRGAIPGLPRVNLQNSLLAYEVDEDFMRWWYMAADGKLDSCAPPG
jgi:hydrogenase small subunit